MQIFIEIGQTVLGILRFFELQDGHCSPSLIGIKFMQRSRCSDINATTNNLTTLTAWLFLVHK